MTEKKPKEPAKRRPGCPVSLKDHQLTSGNGAAKVARWCKRNRQRWLEINRAAVYRYRARLRQLSPG